MAIRVQDVRDILRNERIQGRLTGNLSHPLLVLLLGSGAAGKEAEFQQLTASRWNNADENLHVVSVQRGEQMLLDVEHGRYVLSCKNDDEAKYYLTNILRLIKDKIKEQVISLRNIELCIIADVRDEEFVWAGPCAMLFRYMISGEENIDGSRMYLFCLMDGYNAQYRERYTEAYDGLKAWSQGAPADPVLYIEAESRFESVNKHFVLGESVFQWVLFMGKTDVDGVIYDRNGERMQMIVSFLDPCSNIKTPAEGKTFYSGYVYPNEMDPGVDVALIWQICHERFMDLCRNNPDTASVQEKAKALYEQYPQVQRRVDAGIGQPTSENVSHRLGNGSIGNKIDYLWICERRNDAFLNAEKAWKVSISRLLRTIWAKEALESVKSNVSLTGERVELAGIQEYRERQKRNVQAHMDDMNKWMNGQIDQRITALNAGSNFIETLGQSAENLKDEYLRVLKNMGMDSQKIWQERMYMLVSDKEIVDVLTDIYVDRLNRIERLSDEDITRSIRDFFGEAVKVLWPDNGARFEPYEVQKPDRAKIALVPMSAINLSHNNIQKIENGVSKGKFHYSHPLPLNLLPEFVNCSDRQGECGEEQ